MFFAVNPKRFNVEITNKYIIEKWQQFCADLDILTFNAEESVWLFRK